MINKDFISICFIVITKGLTKFSYRQLLTKSEITTMVVSRTQILFCKEYTITFRIFRKQLFLKHYNDRE